MPKYGGKKEKRINPKVILKFEELQNELDLTFNNLELLAQAFTHSSYVNEHRIRHFDDNERLEFLGDAVLELTISDFLFKKYPSMSEGELTKLRASVVREAALVNFANELTFGKYILLGKGEEITGGRTRPALLADVFEAFIGALYLDQGLTKVIEFLERFIYPKIQTGAFSHVMDYKSQLQEVVQREGQSPLVYKILEEKGPAHNREFVSVVLLANEILGTGVGKSKKEAEQKAAQQALGEFDKHYKSEK